MRHPKYLQSHKLQRGLGALQVILALSLVVGLTVVAKPKYEAFLDKTKITEGFTLAGDSKGKLSEFYVMQSRFPRTASEGAYIQTQSLTPPEFVREMVIDYDDPDNAVVIRVYFKDGTLSGGVTSDDHVYLAGNASSAAGALINWTCGANGIDPSLLPTNCAQ